MKCKSDFKVGWLNKKWAGIRIEVREGISGTRIPEHVFSFSAPPVF
jgi:hypothetical protein